MIEEIYKEFDENFQKVLNDFNNIHESLLRNIKSIENEEYNLETKLYLVQQTLRQMVEVNKRLVVLITSLSTTQKETVRKLVEHLENHTLGRICNASAD